MVKGINRKSILDHSKEEWEKLRTHNQILSRKAKETVLIDIDPDEYLISQGTRLYLPDHAASDQVTWPQIWNCPVQIDPEWEVPEFEKQARYKQLCMKQSKLASHLVANLQLVEDELLSLHALSYSARLFQDPFILAEENVYFKAYDQGLSDYLKLWNPYRIETRYKRDVCLNEYSRDEANKVI